MAGKEAVELDPAIIEAEVRGAVKGTILNAIVLGAGTVDPEIVVVGEPFQVCEEHAGDGERIVPELHARHDFQCPTDGTAAVTEAKLVENHEDVVPFLLLAEHLQGLLGLGTKTQAIGPDLTFTVVAERAVTGLLDQVEHLLQGFLVGLADLLPSRDSEEAFGTFGDGLFSQLLVGATDARQEFLQPLDLIGDALAVGLVARQVAVGRLDFLVGELVGNGQLADRTDNTSFEIIAVCDELLSAVLVGDTVVEHTVNRVFHQPPDLLFLTVSDDAGCDRCTHRHHPFLSA
ncbi:MAG: hypothetical protein A2365_02200 [Candidatus Nealsonbacteria bacterium RIFOXYB1_FULL_40_15]|uniref:Uncharacterized protein n=1 Tax=Candidatus Nealsonbacteria bacterium RIFOXYB1_FULL_40_15 TaxID=1801677 RepID=A0A1G2EM83_9BACT|nr:MAG: hypothetical protein A2365_02200 [Candidatus Nealsonbacteria bacterium RIFOXYB1_FULL_40_15]OGZ28466.1 MAG: hypothetical protein A2562_03280 [Candidatus Nealsonbacteria bacterium RIFOXYD1_FULL_39_11]